MGTKRCIFLTTFLMFAISLVHSYPQNSPPSQDDIGIIENCPLNLSKYPYEASGECIGNQQRIKLWDSFTTTLCLRNAIETLSESLSLRIASQLNNTTIFLTSDLWSICTADQTSFLSQTPSLSTFVYGSSYCSNLTLLDFADLASYRDAESACSGFANFTPDCLACAGAVANLRDEMVEKAPRNGREEKGERAICAVAAVIAVAAVGILNESYAGDFFRCLRVLDRYDPDYIKIKNSLVHILVALIVAITSIILIIVLVKHVTKKKKKKKPVISRELNNNWSTLYRFSKEEIYNAINYYNEKKILGRGSAGHVYKGHLPSGQAIAIKHINPNGNPSSFQREVEGLSRIRHINLVCLFGFCMEDDGNYLVYEYCAGGNLASQLLRKDCLLTWDKRLRILRDCAYALRYLHLRMDGCIVHRDIKLTNILLTDQLEPKLSDFGLARILNVEESKVFTDVRGTVGYMDPEYMSNAKLTCASDIYSFGIVILQMLSGQKVIEFNLDARDQLTRKAKDVSLGSRPQEDFEDPRLEGKVNKADFKSILNIAVLCVAKSSEGRPNIEVVFNDLDKAWKNTDEYKKEKKAKKQVPNTSSPVSMPTSMEMALPA